jgi:hypothetical protein
MPRNDLFNTRASLEDKAWRKSLKKASERRRIANREARAAWSNDTKATSATFPHPPAYSDGEEGSRK